MTFLIIDYMKKKITSIIEANNLLKAGYVLVIVENKTAVCIKESAYFLMNENWHTKIKEDDFDVDAELQKPTLSKPGDIWTLGRHRLICGDSTKEETYTALMDGREANLVITDPPYNVDY